MPMPALKQFFCPLKTKITHLDGEEIDEDEDDEDDGDVLGGLNGDTEVYDDDDDAEAEAVSCLSLARPFSSHLEASSSSAHRPSV